MLTKEIVYHCDLGRKTLKDVFDHWIKKPDMMDVEAWQKEWKEGYFIIEEHSPNHLVIQGRLGKKGLKPDIEVEYTNNKELRVQVSVPSFFFVYCLFPLAFMLFFPLIDMLTPLVLFVGFMLILLYKMPKGGAKSMNDEIIRVFKRKNIEFGSNYEG